MKEEGMRALVWHGKEDIRCDTVTDPEIEQPRDAIVKVTSCAICGSDLHLFHNFIPAMLPGDVMGHEMMGEVVEVGPEAKRQAQGRRPGRRPVHDHLRRVRPVQARQFLGLPDAPTARSISPTRCSATPPQACSATRI